MCWNQTSIKFRRKLKSDGKCYWLIFSTSIYYAPTILQALPCTEGHREKPSPWYHVDDILVGGDTLKN